MNGSSGKKKTPMKNKRPANKGTPVKTPKKGKY